MIFINNKTEKFEALFNVKYSEVLFSICLQGRYNPPCKQFSTPLSQWFCIYEFIERAQMDKHKDGYSDVLSSVHNGKLKIKNVQQ